MFKATHKRRATTLSKTLLTAGLLGGAALSTLGAGSAQAAWETFGNGYRCGFPGSGLAACEFGTETGTVPIDPPGVPMVPSDKLLTLLGGSSIPDLSTVQFNYVTGGDSHPWHVDLDLSGEGQKDFDGGFLGYTMRIAEGFDYKFAVANLEYAAPTDSVTKAIYGSLADYQTSSNAICTLTGDNSTCDISGKQIWVRDTWAASPGIGTDNLANDFAQVPAPLPLLGAGAAFGSIRKLRKFSSQLKTFSMG